MKTELRSIEAEQYLLAAATNPELIDEVMSGARESLFAHDQHLTIFRAIRALYERGQPIDIVTLIEEIGDRDLIPFIGDLYQINYGRDVGGYLKILAGYELRRRLHSVGVELIDRVQTEDPEIVRESACNKLLAVDGPRRGPMSFREIYLEHGNEILRRADNDGELQGLPTGFEQIDRRLNGLKPQDLIIVAARPSMGKTTICMNIAEHNALRGEVVLVFSMEMSAGSLMEKMISSVGGVPLRSIRDGTFVRDEELVEQFKSATLRLRDSGVVIDDRPALTITEMRAAAMMVRRRFGRLSLVVVDYIQLARGEGQSREQEVASVSRGLKALAKEFDIPVIALSQLSRSVESRSGDKRPIMSDLRESGAIEQDADLIAFLYRDDYYNKDSPYKGVAEVIWRKFRNGEVGTDYLGWQGERSRFVNLDRGYQPPKAEHKAEVKPIRRGMEL